MLVFGIKSVQNYGSAARAGLLYCLDGLKTFCIRSSGEVFHSGNSCYYSVQNLLSSCLI
jgi:hypothetical protein